MSIIGKLVRRSIEQGDRDICSFLECNPKARLLDLGCWDGKRTLRFAKVIGTDKIVGLDVKNFGVPFKFIEANIEQGIPIGDGQFDVVTARYIIEHVSSTDLFVKEIYRVLKPGGYAVITAPNMASGRVILELLLNRQPKEAHVSDYFLDNKRKDEAEKHEGFLHKRLFTIEGLVKLLEFHGFEVEKKKRMGYGPVLVKLPSGLYAANLLVKARK